MRTALLLLPATLVACTSSPPPDSRVPIVRIEAGQPDTVAVADLMGDATGLRFESPPEARVTRIAGGGLVVETPAGFSGLAQVPYRGDGAAGVLVVHSVAADGPAGSLRLRVAGLEPDHPDILTFEVVRRDEAGASVPPDLHDEESVVALVDDGPFHDNAIDAHDDYVRLDLDAVPPGRHRLRVAVQAGGLVSNWIALDLADGRPVRR